MKHRLIETLEFIFWIFFGVGLAIAMSDSPLIVRSLDLSAGMTTGVMIGVILFGALVTILGLRYYQRLPVWSRYVLGFIGLVVLVVVFGRAYTNAVSYLADARLSHEWVYQLLAGGLFVLSMFMIANKKELWFFVRYSTVIVLLVMASIAAVFAQFLTPLWFIVLASVLAVYDAIAVWKMETMQEMAMGMAENGLVLGIGVPKSDGNVGLLGGGDVFIISLGTIVMMKVGYGLGASLGMLLALVALLFVAKKEKFYPAVPFILAGFFVGVGLQWVVGL